VTSATRATLVAAGLLAVAAGGTPGVRAAERGDRAGAPAAAAAVPPRLHQLLAGARTVVTGRVTGVQTHDSGRVAVAEIAVDETLKGDDPGTTVRAVEVRSLPSAPVVYTSGEHVLAFLSPAPRTSYLRATLPEGSYLYAAAGRAGVVAASDEPSIDEAGAIVARIVAASRTPEADPEKRRAAARALAFDALGARHPAVVEDGIASLATLPKLEPLADAERLRLDALLTREDLPARLRKRAFAEVAALGLEDAVPALARVEAKDPAVLAAAWEALRRLGAPPDAKVVARELRSTDPDVRSAAAAELLARGPQHVAGVADLALHDPDPAVRASVLEAIAATGAADALPILERGFGDSDWSVRRAAGRGIFQIGGRPAAETFARLTFEGAPEVQRYALTLLRVSGVADDDPLLVKIKTQHPDERVREQAEHGLPFHEH